MVSGVVSGRGLTSSLWSAVYVSRSGPKSTPLLIAAKPCSQSYSE